MMQTGKATPNLHFQKLNSHIDLEDFPAFVVQEMYELEPALSSGLSSFGFGGTNAHVVLASSSTPSAAPTTGAIQMEFKHTPFPWRDPVYRMLRKRISEG